EFAISGPAAGHDRLKTTDDPTGTKVIGTFNNCSGGVTPWGTVLVAEENIHKYFARELPEDHPEKNAHKAMALGKKGLGWEKIYKRFDLSHEPHEPNRFGWVWEYDPYIPLGRSIPVKRTALGRFMHEGATCAL